MENRGCTGYYPVKWSAKYLGSTLRGNKFFSSQDSLYGDYCPQDLAHKYDNFPAESDQLLHTSIRTPFPVGQRDSVRHHELFLLECSIPNIDILGDSMFNTMSYCLDRFLRCVLCDGPARTSEHNCHSWNSYYLAAI